MKAFKELLLKPVKAIAKWGVKRWALAKVNEILAARKTGLDKALAITDKIMDKIDAAKGYVAGVREKLRDGKLDEDEADALVTETVDMVKGLTK